MRLTKKQKEEYAFFINPNTRKRQYNRICRECARACKQSYRAQLISCLRFCPVNSRSQGRKSAVSHRSR